MSNIERLKRARTLRGLNRVGLLLANANHQWTPDERRAYETRRRELKKVK